MKAKLLDDVFSVLKGRRQYGKKGDTVKVIKIFDEVAIVEGKERYAVQINQINIYGTSDQA